jgi:LysM repeat protein
MRAAPASAGVSATIRVTVPLAGAILLVVGVGACGFRGEKVGSSLPPLTVATSTTTTMPTTTTQVRYYKVQSGDSISSIASAFGVSQQELIAINGIANADQIQAGQTLQLPPSTVVVTAPAATEAPPAATVIVTAPPPT